MKLSLLVIVTLLGMAFAAPLVPHGFYRTYISLGHNFNPTKLLGPAGPRLWHSQKYIDFESTFIDDLEKEMNTVQSTAHGRKYVRTLETINKITMVPGSYRKARESFLVLDIVCVEACLESDVAGNLKGYIRKHKRFGSYPVTLRGFTIVQYPVQWIRLPLDGWKPDYSARACQGGKNFDILFKAVANRQNKRKKRSANLANNDMDTMESESENYTEEGCEEDIDAAPAMVDGDLILDDTSIETVDDCEGDEAENIIGDDEIDDIKPADVEPDLTIIIEEENEDDEDTSDDVDDEDEECEDYPGNQNGSTAEPTTEEATTSTEEATTEAPTTKAAETSTAEDNGDCASEDSDELADEDDGDDDEDEEDDGDDMGLDNVLANAEHAFVDDSDIMITSEDGEEEEGDCEEDED